MIPSPFPAKPQPPVAPSPPAGSMPLDPYLEGDPEYWRRGSQPPGMAPLRPPLPAAPFRAAWVCLVGAWGCFLIPVPYLGIPGWALNTVGFVLAIVTLRRGRVAAGLVPLLASITVSPVLWLYGVMLLIANITYRASPTLAHPGPSAPQPPAIDMRNVPTPRPILPPADTGYQQALAATRAIEALKQAATREAAEPAAPR